MSNSNYQYNKISSKIDEIKNKKANYDAIIDNSYYELKRITNKYQIVDKLKDVENYKIQIESNRNNMKLIEVSLRNSIKSKRDVPTNYLSRLEKEKQIWNTELERIIKKKQIIKKEYIEKRMETHTKLLESYKEKDIVRDKLSRVEFGLKRASYLNQHSRHSIINQIKTVKKEKKNNVKKVEEMVNKIDKLKNKISELDYRIHHILPKEKRDANKKYYQIKESIEEKENELESLQKWISDLVDEINWLQTKNQFDNLLDKQNQLASYWKNRDGLISEIQKLKKRKEFDIYQCYLLIDREKVELREHIIIFKDQLIQFENYKYELENPTVIEDKSISINQNELYNYKNKISDYKNQFDIIENNILQYIENLKDLDKFIQVDDSLLNTQEYNANRRLKIMRKRLEKWKKDEVINLEIQISNINDRLESEKEKIENIDQNRHQAEMAITNILSDKLEYNLYNQYNRKIVKNKKLSERCDNEIKSLTKHLGELL